MINTSVDPLIGSIVSHYAIVAKLGGGGMGVVYKAIDTKLGRTVALKFLPPQSSHDEEAKQRFQREAQAASATNHRNICVIHDISETNDGRLFIVMAYYEGMTLKQKLQGGALPMFEALDIAFEVAEGLARAHAHRIIHRDIKPGNLILTDDGVKILDFGLAKFVDALQLTLPGSTVGTTAYMSPEQVRGEDADERSDLWALGVVLYEMLTGHVPFKGSYPEATFHAIKYEPLPPLRIPGRDTPAPVEALVLRMLEKEAARRYQNSREVARDLGAITGRTVPVELRTLPITAPTTPPAAPARAWWRRAFTPARALVASIMLLGIGIGGYRWLARPVVRIQVAIAPVANHTGEPELDDYRLALTETLLEELEQSPNLRVVPFQRVVEIVRPFTGTGDVSSREAIQAVATQTAAPYIVMPAVEYRNTTWLLRADVRNTETGTVTKTYETEGLTAALPKDAVYRLTASLAESIQTDFKAIGPGRSYTRRPSSGRFRNLDAARAFADGLGAYEELEYSAALEAFRRAAMQDSQHAITQAWIGRTMLMMFQSQAAVEAAKRAKQLLAAEAPRGDAMLVEAILAEAQGDFKMAESLYRERTGLTPDDATPQIDLADFLKRRSQDQQAISAYREALRRDPGYARPHIDLSQLYTRIDEYPLAEQEANAALNTYRAAGNRSGEAQALLAVSELQRRQGKLADAQRTADEARNIFELLGLVYGLSRVYQYLAIVAGYSGDYKGAVGFFEQALARSREVGNRDMEGIVLNNLGVVSERLGDKVRALKYYEQSRDVYEDTGNEAHAAEEEANTAGLLIDYGSNQADTLRRLQNARATFKKLGNVEFEILTMEFEASSALHTGWHEDARRQLLAALNIAKDRKYNNRVNSMTIKLAESFFLTSEYEEARKRLEEVAASAAGRDDAEAAVGLGRVYVRLGDFTTARKHLDRALEAIDSKQQLAVLPGAHLALGELEYESGRMPIAQTHFKKAASLWTDNLPDVASVEATCYQAAIDGPEGNPATAVMKGVEQARRMGRLASEAVCRLAGARIDIRRQQYANALSSLNGIPAEKNRTVGSELEARVHYWRSLALAGQSSLESAESEAAAARTLAKQLQASLPETYRQSFASRIEIRRVLESAPVR
ncbi:MAG: hypothetical protein C5B57_13740 [Blastocatellia bacterium]|nr:MAG: hypothetical protein C5B57_13740 [Blastocatellia bacterium]